MNRAFIRRHRVLVCILLAYAMYAGAYIYRTSFIVHGERYFSLFDDAMVSMRYGRNLAQGYGLVWNPGGERIEGYTNPLWVLYMAAVHLLPLSAAKISVLIQATGAAMLSLDLVLVAKLTERMSGESTLAAATATLLTAFYLPLNNWGLQGMEVSLLCLMITSSVTIVLRGLESQRVPRILYLILGLGTLVRLDMVVPFVAILLFLLVFDEKNRPQHAWLGLASLAFFVGGQTLFRWSYYGDLLPNTYYLKMTGYPLLYRAERGAIVLFEFAYRLALGLLPLLIGVVHLPRDRRMTLLLTIIAVQAAYSVYVGGDAWEWAGGSNRYLSIAMPLLFVLFGCGLDRWRQTWARGGEVRPAKAAGALTWHNQALTGSLVFLSIVALNVTIAPNAWREWMLMSKPLHTTDNADKVRRALLVDELTTPDARVAVVWAGAAPYFMNRPTVDMLGKNDPVIAHEPMRLPPIAAPRSEAITFFYPGHLKYDYGYSIGHLRPDVVTELWCDEDEAEPYLEKFYRAITVSGFPLFLRRTSSRIAWKRIDSAKAGGTLQQAMRIASACPPERQ